MSASENSEDDVCGNWDTLLDQANRSVLTSLRFLKEEVSKEHGFVFLNNNPGLLGSLVLSSQINAGTRGIRESLI